jgi:hypothetical protein
MVRRELLWKPSPQRAFVGHIEELNLVAPEYYQESMKAPLEAAGFRPVLIRRDQIGEYKDQGAKPVYVTDKKKWRKEVQKAEHILFVKPTENE